jgi:RNA polymerase subunit RPABC4/transcription elongation factor Spt4
MSLTPGPSGEYEVVVHRADAWSRRLRAAAHGGRIRLAHLRRWLSTPEGRHATARAARSLAVAAAIAGAIVLVRRWADGARSAFAAVAAGYRTAAGAVGAAADGVRFVLSLSWFSRLLRWSSRGAISGAHRPCPDCHARIRSDAHVCYRCGCRDLTPLPRGRLAWLRGVSRVLLLRVYRRCPDCRRYVHADARVCHSCGYRLPS